MGTVHAKQAGGVTGDGYGDEYGGGDGVFELDASSPAESSAPAPALRLSGVRARVDRVHVDGLSRTKDDIVKGAVQHLFQATDFEDVIVRAHRARRALDALGCFKDIGVLIDVAAGPGASPEGLEVTFRVKELSRIVGGVSTMVGENEGSLVLGAKLPNVAGRGERLAAEYSMGHRSSSNFSLVASKPLPLRPLAPVLSATAYQQSHEAPWSGYRCTERGVVFDCSFKTGPITSHSIQWEGLVRELGVLGKGAAFPVRSEAGPQLKSLIRHIVCIDARDEPVFPTKGHLVRFSSEVCGLGGGVAHLRTDLKVQRAVLVAPHTTLSVSAACGALHDVCGSRAPDRVFAGGPTSVRGFGPRGLGPHADRCALGARGYWAGGVSLLGPLPGLGAGGGLAALLRAHVFVNAGWAGDEWARAAELRAALGAGVAVRVGGAARLELNYVWPVRAAPEDRTAPGVQFGIGAHFL